MTTDHRVQRAFERYGVVLTRDNIKELERRVSADNLLKKQDGGGIHLLPWKDDHLIAGVAYNDHGPAICTFLPADLFTAGRHQSWMKWSRKTRRRTARRRQGRHHREAGADA